MFSMQKFQVVDPGYFIAIFYKIGRNLYTFLSRLRSQFSRLSMTLYSFAGTMSSDAPSDPIFTHVEAGKLLNSLLKLRQACCHPQVGSSGLRSLQQSPMTMEEILSVG